MGTNFPFTGGKPALPATGQPGPMQPGEFTSGATPNFTEFRFKDVDPPSPLYIQKDDILFLQAVTNSLPDTVIFNASTLLAPFPRGGQPSDPQGAPIQPVPTSSNIIDTFTGQLPLVTVGSIVTKAIPLSEGYLLRVSAASFNNFVRGRTFVRALILRGGSIVNNTSVALFADYAIATGQATWPGGRVLTPVEGPGWKHSLQVGNPAAGADWTLTLNATQRLRVESLNAVLTTSATVANRQVQIIVDDGVNVVAVFPASVNIVAGATANVTAGAVAVPTSVITTDVQISIPTPLILEPGWRIRTSTVGIQVGDQWSAIWLNVEEWLQVI